MTITKFGPARQSPPIGGAAGKSDGQPKERPSARSAARMVAHSVTGLGRHGYAALHQVTHPRGWRLWTYPKRVIGWVVGWELGIGAALVVAGLAGPAGTAHQWWVAGVLLAAALLHHGLTVAGEERRFVEDATASPAGEHIELTSLWLAPAAALLTVPQMTLLVVIIRCQRWLIARKPATQWHFATAAIAGSMLAAHLIDTALLGPGGSGSVRVPLALVCSAGAYFGVQTVLVPGVRVLAGDTPLRELSLVEVVGDRRENGQEAGALAVAAAFTALAAWSPLLLLVAALPVAVAATRLIEAESAARRTASAATRAAGIDAKTGLFNVAGWQPLAAATVTRSSASRPTALLVIDLDKLKRHNDRLGHHGADLVILAVAGQLREATRPGDTACRWGGDEFVVTLPDTHLAEAAEIAERIRARVAALCFPVSEPAGGDPVIVGQGTDDPVTVTIGVAIAPHHGRTAEEVFAAADRLLLAGKNRGERNTVHVVMDLAGGVIAPRAGDPQALTG
jgi:diguanylate cyclase (GGDEF)-like protein